MQWQKMKPRVTEVGRDVQFLVQPACSRQGQLDQVTQDSAQLAFKHLLRVQSSLVTCASV